MSTATTNITTIKTPNPQGKGLSTTLSDWQYFSPQQHQDRPAERLFADYFTSTLVLSAEFGFKPVINQQYYLYHQNQQWTLSLIEPERWQQKAPGICLGQCQLHPDMTWSITPDMASFEDHGLQQSISDFSQQLHQHIKQNAATEQLLPFYAEQLPYYRRMAASGLARSISASTNYAARLQDIASSSPQPLAFITSLTHTTPIKK